jgi:hypothetical protein
LNDFYKNAKINLSCNIRRNIASWAAIERVGLYCIPVGFIGERACRGCFRKVGSARLLEEGTTSRGLLEDSRASRGCLEKFGLAGFVGGRQGILGDIRTSMGGWRGRVGIGCFRRVGQ